MQISVFRYKVLLTKATPLDLCIVYGCFCILKAVEWLWQRLNGLQSQNTFFLTFTENLCSDSWPSEWDDMFCGVFSFLCLPWRIENYSGFACFLSSVIFVLTMCIVICGRSSSSCTLVSGAACQGGQQPVWCPCPVTSGRSPSVFHSRPSWLVSSFVWDFPEVSCSPRDYVNPVFFQLLPFWLNQTSSYLQQKLWQV